MLVSLVFGYCPRFLRALLAYTSVVLVGCLKFIPMVTLTIILTWLLSVTCSEALLIVMPEGGGGWGVGISDLCLARGVLCPIAADKHGY